MSESKMIRVIHKVMAYIEGVTYRAGDEATIAEHHFNEAVHTLVEEPAAAPAAPATDTPATAADAAAGEGSPAAGATPAGAVEPQP
jgi:ribosomal protein L12E/L44/L45/RPP1/RPP2